MCSSSQGGGNQSLYLGWNEPVGLDDYLAVLMRMIGCFLLAVALVSIGMLAPGRGWLFLYLYIPAIGLLGLHLVCRRWRLWPGIVVLIPGLLYFANVVPLNPLALPVSIFVFCVGLQIAVFAMSVMAGVSAQSCAVALSLLARLALVSALVPATHSAVTAFGGDKAQFVVVMCLTVVVPALWIGPSIIFSYAQYLLRLPSTTPRGYEVLEEFAAPLDEEASGASSLPTIWLLLILATAAVAICSIVGMVYRFLVPEYLPGLAVLGLGLTVLGFDIRTGILPQSMEWKAPFDAAVIWLRGKDLQDEEERRQVTWQRWLRVSFLCVLVVIRSATANGQELEVHLDSATLSVSGFNEFVAFLLRASWHDLYLVPASIFVLGGVHRAMWLRGIADRLQ